MIPAGQRLPDASSSAVHRELVREGARYFEANRWIGPIGLTAATALYFVLVSRHSSPPERLELWLALILSLVAVQVVVFVHPRLGLVLDRKGVPVSSLMMYALLGTGWGSTLWLDGSSVQDAEFRWTTLATMFAISGGASAGLSGVNSLGRWLIVPMWLLAASSLLMHGHAITAVAVVVYLGITIRDMHENGVLWAELIGRRVQATRDAEASANAAARDPLTGLLNRTGLMNSLSDRSTMDEPGSETATILFIDLDHFKSINDRYGHRTGDLVLIDVAERLCRTLRSEDAIARIGGDEFCALLGRAEQPANAVELAERIIVQLAAPVRTSTGDEVTISASVGVAEMSTVQIDVEQLLMDADHAMYQAKRRGRNQVVYFDEDLKRDLIERSQLTAGLRQAIRDQTLATASRALVSSEGETTVAIDLVPYWGDDFSTLTSHTIVTTAIENDLMADLATLLLRAAADLQRERRSHPQSAAVPISFAVSAKSVLRNQIRDRVDEAVCNHGLDPAGLSLRLTDVGVPVMGRPDLLASFHELTQRGITLELDDVGRGDGSIGNLLSLPINTVRLDPSIIDAMQTSQPHAAIVESIAGLCRSLGQTVLAIGVSEARRVEALEAMGITTVRLGEPAPLRPASIRPSP